MRETVPSPLDHLLQITEDGVLWKARRIWQSATNPDAQVKALEKIVDMLLCIANTTKRSAYAQRICDSLTSQAKENEESIKRIDIQIRQAEKDIIRLEGNRQVDDKIAAAEKQLAKAEARAKPDEKVLAAQRELVQQLKGRKETEEQILADHRAGLEALQRRKVFLEGSRREKLSTMELLKAVKDTADDREKARQRREKQLVDGERMQKAEDLNLPHDFDQTRVAEAKLYGVGAYKGYYLSRRMSPKGEVSWEAVSNFTMKIIYHVQTGQDRAYRMMEFKNVYGEEKVVNVNTDDFVSVMPFKKILGRMGHFTFSGSEVDLTRLANYLQKDEKATDFVQVLGFNPRKHFYAFSNGLLDTNVESDVAPFHPIDTHGIVTLRDRNYFLPALAKMHEESDGFVDERKFLFIPNNRVSFEKWSELHHQVYGDAGIIGQLWVLSAIFRDAIWSVNRIRSTPILALYGQPGTGKGRFAESLLALFGHPQPPISLGSDSTTKGFLRKFAQYRNAVVWLDEYKNSINPKLKETIKQIFDGNSYTRAQRTSGFETDAPPVNSACMLSGQEMPTSEAALFMRTIMLTFEPVRNRAQDALDRYERLKNQEAYGLSGIMAEILARRSQFCAAFESVYEQKLKLIKGKLADNPGIDDRYIMNISIMAAVGDVLRSAGLKFAYPQMLAEDALVLNLRNQFGISQGTNDLGKWWQVIDQLIIEGRLLPKRDFRYEEGMFMLVVPIAHSAYLEALARRRDPHFLDKASLENYLKSDKDTFVDSSRQRFDGYAQGQYCMRFKHSPLCDKYKVALTAFSREGVDFEPVLTPPASGATVEKPPF